ncbi:MAG: hypothetical protein CL583_17500 [Alteromonadaceae bacterium]|nr:hypothetical protein [Alteromonadaceae bacterium]
MISIRALAGKLGNPLDWSSCGKALLLLGISLFYHVQYTWTAHYLLGRDDREQLVNVANVEHLINNFHLLVALTVVLFALIPIFRRTYGDRVWYEYLAAIYYGLSLCYFSYTIGTLTLPTGAALAGTPVVGFIFFNRGAILTALGLSLVALIGISYAAAVGYIPYAPIILHPLGANGQLSMEWMTLMYIYTAPHLVVLILLAYYVLRRWRQREDEVRLLSLTDVLTGLANRRSILSYLNREQDRSVRQGVPLTVLLMDLDNFKQINDTWGHPVGDEILVKVGHVLRDAVRQNDQVGRFGGEEFLIVLPGTDVPGAMLLAERCRAAIADISVSVGGGQDLRVTGSFGLFCNASDRTLEVQDMLRFVDEALYLAKERGRNRIEISKGRPPSPGLLGTHNGALIGAPTMR